MDGNLHRATFPLHTKSRALDNLSYRNFYKNTHVSRLLSEFIFHLSVLCPRPKIHQAVCSERGTLGEKFEILGGPVNSGFLVCAHTHIYLRPQLRFLGHQHELFVFPGRLALSRSLPVARALCARAGLNINRLY